VQLSSGLGHEAPRSFAVPFIEPPYFEPPYFARSPQLSTALASAHRVVSTASNLRACTCVT